MILKVERLIGIEEFNDHLDYVKTDLRKRIARELLRRGLEAPANEVFEIIHLKPGAKGIPFVSAKPENATHALIRLEQEA